MAHQLILPMGFYVFYIGGLIIYNLVRRLKAVKLNETSGAYFKTYSKKEGVPDYLLVLERHVDNQFQLPTLFLITCTAHMVVGEVNLLTVGLAWTFIACRLLHSYIHLGSNKILLRAKVYGAGWLVVWALWIQLFFLIEL